MSDAELRERNYNRYFHDTPREVPLAVPATGIFDEPTKCIKVNHAWFSHIVGQIDILANEHNWLGDDDERLRAVREISKALGEVRCMIDCAQVEMCLETSPTIESILAELAQAQEELEQAQQELDELRDKPGDGNVYPPMPAPSSVPACGASWYIVQELRVYIAGIEALPQSYTLLEAIAQALNDVIERIVANIYTLLGNVYNPSYQSILTAYDAIADAMRERLYCESLDKEDFSAWLRTIGQGAIADYVDSIAFTAWDRWIAIGQADSSRDCTSYCGVAVMVWSFTGKAVYSETISGLAPNTNYELRTFGGVNQGVRWGDQPQQVGDALYWFPNGTGNANQKLGSVNAGLWVNGTSPSNAYDISGDGGYIVIVTSNASGQITFELRDPAPAGNLNDMSFELWTIL